MEEEIVLKLSAMLVTDGCIIGSPKKLKIRFINKADSLHHEFKNLVRKLVKDKVKILEVMDKNGVKTSEVNSNRLARFLNSLIGKPKHLPLELMENCDKNLLNEILKLMFSCDGSPVFTWKFDKKKRIWRNVRRIKFASKNRKLLLQVVEILHQLGFHPQISTQEIILERKSDILKFANEIKFVEGVKMGKRSKWNFLTKNDVLDMMVSSFDSLHRAQTG